MFTKHIGKYARLELERRFLVPTVPEGLGEGWRITDRYLTGTRLRLRRMEKLVGEKTIHKLGQKFRGPDQGPTEATMTTMYLTSEEYGRLSAMKGAELVKHRFAYEAGGLRYSLDVFQNALDGLVLAEIEQPDAEALDRIEPADPSWVDVTEEPFFSGASLAMLTREAFQSGLESWREINR